MIYIYELVKYIEIEADSKEQAESTLWDAVEEEGTENLDATLVQTIDGDKVTYHD